tara:strand:- start:4688 stop:5107 length:420 start_codon:yes stop_codon:yes gene_type:complete
MDLSREADIYAPNIDKNGNYVDIIPSFNYGNGFYCPCGSRKDKVYNTKSKLSSHTKTKCHQKWLVNLNLNKNNFYTEYEKLKEIVKSQKIIIGEQDKNLSNKILTINYLTEKMMNYELFNNGNNGNNGNNVKIADLINL